MSWKLLINHINVGAGDSILIRVYNDVKLERTVLIDVGTRTAGRQQVLPFLVAQGVQHIDAIVITHYDSDHVGGFNELFCNEAYLYLLDETRVYDTGIYKNFSERNKDRETPYTTYVRIINELVKQRKVIHVTSFETETFAMGTEILWGSELLNIPIAKGNIAKLRSVNPASLDKPALFCIASNKEYIEPMIIGPKDNTTDINQRSIALVLVSENNKILYYAAGDLGDKYESKLLPWLKESLGDNPLPVMKVSHHGGKYSTPYNFISLLRPSNAVISCGQNKRYWHPSLAVLAAFADNNIQSAPGEDTIVFSTNYPVYLEDQALFSEYIESRLNKSIKYLLTQLQTNQIKDCIDTLAQNKQLVDGKEIWKSCNGHSSNATYSGSTYTVGSGGSPSRFLTNVEVEFVYSGVASAYHAYVSQRFFNPIKRKRPDFIASFALTAGYTIGASGTSGVDINLAKNCDLDQFVSRLNPPKLMLNGNPINHSCTIINTSVLGDWFELCGFSISMTIKDLPLQNECLDVSCSDVTFEAKFNETQLGANISLIGALTQDGILAFDKLSDSSINIETSPLKHAQFLGFVGRRGALFSYIASLPISVLQQTPSMITFSPPSVTALSQTQLQLTSNIGDISLGSLSLSDIILTFSQILHSTLDNSLTGECTANFSAKLAVQGSSETLAASVKLSPAGTAELTVTPSAASLENLIQVALPKSKAYADLITFCRDITVKSLLLNFDLALLQINTIQLVSQISFYGLILEIDATLPNPMIFGTLVDPSTGLSSFKTFADNAKFTVPNGFPSFDFVDFCFSAQYVTGDYSCSAALELGDGNNTWVLNDHIMLEGLRFSFNHFGGILKNNLSSFFLIGTQWAIIEGEYTTTDGWKFSATVSSLNLSDILVCVGCDPQCLPISKKDLSLTKINLTIDVNSKTFSLTADTELGEIVLVIRDDVKLFILGLPNNDHLVLPVVGQIPTVTDSLQLIYATKAIKQDDLALILFQTITSAPLPMPKNGLSEGLQLLINFNNGLGLNENTYALNIWSPRPVEKTTNIVSFTTLPSQDPLTSNSLFIAVHRSLGPLILNRLGLSFHDNRLWLLFDAEIMLGELKIHLDNLSVGITLDATSLPDVSLTSLGLDYQTGVVNIAGNFLHNGSSYQGVATLGIEDLTVAGIGSYGVSVDNQPSIFIFARMNEPLGGPPFFYVMGFSAGFGYNWRLRVPTQAEVVNFPLVTGSIDPSLVSPLTDMSSMLNQLTCGENPWLSPNDGDQWLAAGLDFTICELINTRALIVAEFGKDSQFLLLGRSYMQLPKVTKPPVVYAEMGMEACYNPDKGSLSMTALLSSNSYVLTPDCHLTGGFAFYSWFKNQASGAKKGDFVVSMGGYHPSFKPPPWYPKLPRLGFNWKVNHQVDITGEAYCALTPASVMMGGMLNVSLHAGNLCAWFRACADFLIAWYPFNYSVDISVSVGASYRLHTLFFTKTFRIEKSATLHLEGPPTHGNVHIDWYVISFSISFGRKATVTPVLSWTAFRELLPKATELAAHQSTTASTVSLNRIIVATGLLAESTSNATWVVRADTFKFYTVAAIPVTKVTYNGETISDENGQKSPADPIYVRPMGINQGIKHTHAVTVNAPGKWTVVINTENVPDALWGFPGSPTLNASLLPNRWVGMTISAPSAKKGKTPGLMAAEAFGDVLVHDAPLPLNEKPNPAMPIPEKDVEHSRKRVAETICEKNNLRNKYANTLFSMGLFKTKPSLDSMESMAEKVLQGTCLSEPPLQTTSTL